MSLLATEETSEALLAAKLLLIVELLANELLGTELLVKAEELNALESDEAALWLISLLVLGSLLTLDSLLALDVLLACA